MTALTVADNRRVVAAPFPVRITATRTVADGVLELSLSAPDGAALPRWAPGAHIDLHLGEHVRQYSLCGPVDADAWTVAVLREPDGRGGSAAAHGLRAGDDLLAAGPRNHFELEAAPAYQFVAGGIGITPLLPMIRSAQDAGIPWSLLYGGRSRSSMAYLAELATYGDRVQIRPQDEHGLLDLASLRDTLVPGTRVYACGPEPLLTAVEETLADQRVHTERFTARTLDDVEDTAFEVVFDRSGITATVPPGVSVLDVAAANGIFVLRSCSEGICGTCETVVLDGEPEHRDSVYTDDDHAEGAFAPCISRCRSGRLVLDL